MLSWDYYRKRKRLKIEPWLKANGIDSYEKFCKILHHVGIKPPLLCNAPASLREEFKRRKRVTPKAQPEPKPKSPAKLATVAVKAVKKAPVKKATTLKKAAPSKAGSKSTSPKTKSPKITKKKLTKASVGLSVVTDENSEITS